MANNPADQLENHREQYEVISDSLDRVRNTFLSSDRFTQRVLLFDSVTFAVMSVQNSTDILARQYRAYCRADDWESVREAFKGVNYGKNKYQYTRHNFDVAFEKSGESVIKTLENGDVWGAVEILVENFKGVSWIKAGFVPAMLGFKEVMCIDTNVAQMVDDESVKAQDYKSGSEYRDAVDRVKDEYPDVSEETSAFMLQWILFDANRKKGVIKHEEWFNHALPGSPFANQMALSEY